MNRLMLTTAVVLAAAAANAFTLVENGKAAPVVLPSGAEESSKLAATEWTNYVFRATGIASQVKVKGEGEQWNDTSSVIIGTLATLKDVPQAIREKLAESKSYEASATASIDGNFWIVGKESVAELYGTYRLLEDQLGVRWFKAWEPDDPGDYVPWFGGQRSEVKGQTKDDQFHSLISDLKPLTFSIDGKITLRAPHFRKRTLNMTGSSTAYIPYRGYEWVFRAGLQTDPPCRSGLDFMKFLLGPRPVLGEKPTSQERNRLRDWDFYKPRLFVRELGVGGGHTTFFRPIPPNEYFDAHPEYFAEVRGKRVKGERYCLSNTNVQHIVAQHIIETLRVTGDRGTYLFGLQDGRSGICECANCRALDDAGAKMRPLNTDISTRFNKVVKNIAAEVYRAYPDTQALVDWVYSIYGVTPPTDVRHDPRMAAQFCITSRCYGHRLDDPNCIFNVQRLKWLKDWMKLFSRGYMYDYGNCSANFYAPYELNYAQDLKLYASLGIVGWNEEMTFVDSRPPSRFSNDPEKIRRRSEKSPSNWQWLYVTSRILWNPALDPQAILDEIEPKYYGPAYPAMKKYHALRRKLWMENTMCMGFPRANPRAPTLLNVPGAKEELLGYLAEAEKLVQVESPSPRKDEDVHSPTSTQDSNSLFRTRVAKDRRWLNIFWIEPNEKLRAKAGKTLWSPVAKSAPTIDGSGEDAVWKDACLTTDFLETYVADQKPPRPELATQVAILSDAENLYFKFACMEPSTDRIVAEKGDGEAVYEDDSVELFLYPPSEANTYFQFCVNTKGRMVCYEQPRCRKRDDIGAVAAASVAKDRYTIEIRVPVTKMYPLKRGDTWNVFVHRSRRLNDGLTPGRSGAWSLDGGKVNNTTDYRPMKIGDRPAPVL